MLYHRYTLTDTIAWSASSTVSVDLPKNGYITQIDCHLVLNVTAAATVVAATTDPLIQAVSACRINAAGETYFDVADGRDWWFWSAQRHRAMIQVDSLPSSGNTQNCRTLYEIHLGYNPKNPFDPSVVIPTRRLSNPKMEITWNAASDLGTGYTVNSGFMYLNITELVLEPGEREQDIWPNGLLVPRVENATEALDTAHSNRGLRHDVPVSLVLYQTNVLVIDGSDDRSDTPVTEFSVEMPPQRETPMDFNSADFKMINAKELEVMSLIDAEANRQPYDGVALLQWPSISGNPRGIDLSQMKVGDVQLGFTNAATGSGVVRLLHVGYQPE